MGIDAQRGADIPVARQFLHDLRIDFLLQQHGSVGVTEPPGTEGFQRICLFVAFIASVSFNNFNGQITDRMLMLLTAILI